MMLCVLALVLALGGAAATTAASSRAQQQPPTVAELGSQWVNPTKTISAAADVGPEQRDLATINNFWGAGGIAPQTLRPVDLIAVNSLELPPYSGCGAAMNADLPSGYGCGRLLVDGQQPTVTATRWQTHEAGRRTAPLPGSGVIVESAMRMPFEQNGVVWEVNFTTAGDSGATIRLDFELSAMMNKLPTVGTWVYPTVNTAEFFNFSAITGGSGGQKGVLSCGGGKGSSSRSACSRFVFVGLQPDAITFPPLPPPPPPPSPPSPLAGCSIAGVWIQETAGGQLFGPIVEDTATRSFSWFNNNSAEADKWGWDHFNGTISADGKISYHYYHTKTRGGAPTADTGAFNKDCDHVKMRDACWHRKGGKSNCGGHLPVPKFSPVPNATFSAVHIQAGATVTIRLAMAVGDDEAGAAAAESKFAADPATFATAFAEAHSKWEERWQKAFEPANGYWSGNLPTLSLPGSVGANVERVYYMSALTVVSQMRSNLLLVGPRVWPNGNGNVSSN